MRPQFQRDLVVLVINVVGLAVPTRRCGALATLGAFRQVPFGR